MLNLPKFLFAAAKYDLGDAVGEQLEDAVYHGAGWEDQNPAALRLCLDWLNRNAEDLNDHLNEETGDELSSMVASLEDYLG